MSSAAQSERSATRAVVGLALGVLLTGCATTNRSGFTPIGSTHPARAAGCEVEIFQRDLPARDFARIARLDVHIEWSAWFEPRLADAVAELRKQACLAGADAIIDLDERRGSHIETKRYHVTATGIIYR